MLHHWVKCNARYKCLLKWLTRPVRKKEKKKNETNKKLLENNMLMKWTYHVKNLSDHLQHITRTKTQKKQQQKSDTYLTAYLCIYVQDLFQTFNFFLHEILVWFSGQSHCNCFTNCACADWPYKKGEDNVVFFFSFFAGCLNCLASHNTHELVK